MIDLDLNQVGVPFDWPEIFGRSAPVDVEIGSGKGKFLLELARSVSPSATSSRSNGPASTTSSAVTGPLDAGISNVRLLRTTAEDLLFRLLARSVGGTHLRPLSRPVAQETPPQTPPRSNRMSSRRCNRALIPGGRLLVKTDHEGYAEVISEVLRGAEDFTALDPEEAFAGLPRPASSTSTATRDGRSSPSRCRKRLTRSPRTAKTHASQRQRKQTIDR